MKIKGQRVILYDDPRESSSEDFFRWFNLEEWQYYDSPDRPFQPISQEAFDQRAKKNRERLEQRKKQETKDSPAARPSPGWHIDTMDGEHIGWVNYYQWDPEEKSAFIGISIPEEENWGKGYGSEAVRLFLKLLFETYGFKTIRAATWTGNKRMVRCAQKAGFRDYQLMPHRASISVRGEPLERIEFTLSSAEWFKTDRDGG